MQTKKTHTPFELHSIPENDSVAFRLSHQQRNTTQSLRWRFVSLSHSKSPCLISLEFRNLYTLSQFALPPYNSAVEIQPQQQQQQHHNREDPMTAPIWPTIVQQQQQQQSNVAELPNNPGLYGSGMFRNLFEGLQSKLIRII